MQAHPLKLKRYRNDTQEALLNAYEAVKKGKVKVKRAAFQFRVPEQTLRDRVKGKVDPIISKSGTDTMLTKEEEKSLIEHIETMSELGYGYSNAQVQYLAVDVAFDLGRRHERKPLGNNWLAGFLKRWEGRISSLKPGSLDTNRAKSATPENVESYFKNLEEIVEKYDLGDKPKCIYNLDETGIQPEHRPPNVIAPVGNKPHAVASPRSTTTTVIGCVNATGNSVPPFFVFKGKRWNADLMKGATPDAHGVMSDSGWSNGDTFRTYLEDHFIPNLRSGCSDDQNILLICDGHTSHVSKAIIEWAISKNIIIFILPAHTSHLLQPLDVSVFSPFRTWYYSECATYMRTRIGQTVTRYELCELACTAYMKAITPQNIISGFKKTGIYPLSKEVVPKDKLFPRESFRDSTPVQKATALKAGKEALEQYLIMKAEKNMNCMCDCHEMLKTSRQLQQPIQNQTLEVKPSPKKRINAMDQIQCFRC